jgi:hypothetical protein
MAYIPMLLEAVSIFLYILGKGKISNRLGGKNYVIRIPFADLLFSDALVNKPFGFIYV